VEKRGGCKGKDKKNMDNSQENYIEKEGTVKEGEG
jgi:hypothetical protein